MIWLRGWSGTLEGPRVINTCQGISWHRNRPSCKIKGSTTSVKTNPTFKMLELPSFESFSHESDPTKPNQTQPSFPSKLIHSCFNPLQILLPTLLRFQVNYYHNQMLRKIHIVPCCVTSIFPFIYYLNGYHQNKVFIFRPKITLQWGTES